MRYLREESNLREVSFGPVVEVEARESELNIRQSCLCGFCGSRTIGNISDTFGPSLYCEGSEMASIPMGVHAAFKVRESLNSGGGGCGNGKPPGQSSFQQTPSPTNEMQYNPPAKYNGKLMNSIWGMYNRYSVHNIKSHIAFDKA